MTDCATWPVDTACLPESWDDLEVETQDQALLLASATLSRLTGGRVGNCPVTVRPSVMRPAIPTYVTNYPVIGSAYVPVNWNGIWSNMVLCDPGVRCQITLPGPVGRLDEVLVDGSPLNLSDVAVYDGNLMVWQGTGDCPWNLHQDLSKPTTDAGTFAITYLNAYPVDSLGQCALAALASEFAQGMVGGDCRLPENVVSIVRQGITMEVASGAFPGGETGLREVDTWVALWNPHHLAQAPAVWSPDLPVNHVRTL